MDDVTIGQFVSANVVLIVIVLVVAVASTLLIWRARRNRMRRLPVTLGGVRIEYQGMRLDEDLVVECNWRMTFLLTNTTRRPRVVPVLGTRAVIRAGGREYAGQVYLERAAAELNPGEALVVWVVCQLPAGAVPGRMTLECLREVRMPLARRHNLRLGVLSPNGY